MPKIHPEVQNFQCHNMIMKFHKKNSKIKKAHKMIKLLRNDTRAFLHYFNSYDCSNHVLTLLNHTNS